MTNWIQEWADLSCNPVKRSVRIVAGWILTIVGPIFVLGFAGYTLYQHPRGTIAFVGFVSFFMFLAWLIHPEYDCRPPDEPTRE